MSASDTAAFGGVHIPGSINIGLAKQTANWIGMVIDPDTMEFEYVDNGSSQAMSQGAGIQTAELMTQHGVGIVLTGYVGPKAFHALSAVGIQIGQNLEDLTVREALERYKSGAVSMAAVPNRSGSGGKP